jgi:RNA polymerase sigma-70 factor (ECF subfamily)
MEENPEADIIERAATGDAHAFRLLVEKYQGYAVRLAMRFVGSRFDAEDVVQEVFIRIWKNLHRYRKEVKFSTWLYRIVTNRCLDFLKSSKRRPIHLTDTLEKHQQVIDPGTTRSSYEGKEFVFLVTKMSERLTPKQKAVFILRDLEGLSVKEVCEILSMSTGNVKGNLYHARISMSELMKKCYSENKMYES